MMAGLVCENVWDGVYLGHRDQVQQTVLDFQNKLLLPQVVYRSGHELYMKAQISD